MFVDQFYFYSYACPPPVNVMNQIIIINSEYQIQNNDSYCASYFLYFLYLTQTVGYRQEFIDKIAACGFNDFSKSN